MSQGAKLWARLDEVKEVECNTELFCNIEKSRQGKIFIDCHFGEKMKALLTDRTF